MTTPTHLYRPCRATLFSVLLLSLLTVISARAAEPWPPGKSPVEIGQRVAERFYLMPRASLNRYKPSGEITYPETCTWYGALTFAQLAGDTNLTQKLVARFEPLLGPEQQLVPRPRHVDPTVFGAVPLEIFVQTRDKRGLELGRLMADAQWTPTTNLASLPATTRRYVEQGLSPQTRFWIDDMFMLTLLQTQAFRATQDRTYLDRAALEMSTYLDTLQQTNGLFYHAPDVPFYWGRGNGWVAAGMSELLRSLPPDHPRHAHIMAGYKTMMATLRRYQGNDGMWRQLLDRPESWPESSCTGMFTFAFITGVKNGWLDEKEYGVAARNGWLALVSRLDEQANIKDVCEGTNKKNSLEYYLGRKRNTGDLHGQAPILWCASAWLRPGK